MDKPCVQFEVKNLDEFKKLLQKAANQLEQLQKTIEQIEEYKPEIKLH